MLSFLTKKKISEAKLADVFVTSVLKLVDEGFPELAEMINNDPDFKFSPDIKADEADRFLLIVLAGNLERLPQHFHDYRDVRLMESIHNKLASALNVDAEKLKRAIAKYQSFFSKVNAPSKNTLYAMSKAVFFKYELNQYQDEYFRKMNAPNPLFLKRLDDVMACFLWDWSEVKGSYKIVE